MKTVATLTGPRWKQLAKELFNYQSSSETDFQVEDNFRYKGDDFDSCFDMLRKWRMESEHPTRQTLIKALRTSKFDSIERELIEKWKSD